MYSDIVMADSVRTFYIVDICYKVGSCLRGASWGWALGTIMSHRLASHHTQACEVLLASLNSY